MTSHSRRAFLKRCAALTGGLSVPWGASPPLQASSRGVEVTGRVTSRGEGESAAPGYYSVNLSRHDIDAELTATRRVGYHRYTFPASDQARILIDAGHFLSSSAPWNEEQKLVGSKIEVVSDRVVQGYSRVRGG